ncbi:hypothetical protein RGCCGE502_17515 [Rhizobium grahamii CCGE 502]|uniref:Uncharacterized protein n=1 Tax=Rhizobium grahamii CCGE 502 TaxID=990285 RepID=S3HDR7_9HYPH|nr:hypothetical protein RGCCGE502_17515 [Rhizobium grahamii CCGE 502]
MRLPDSLSQRTERARVDMQGSECPFDVATLQIGNDLLQHDLAGNFVGRLAEGPLNLGRELVDEIRKLLAKTGHYSVSAPLTTFFGAAGSPFPSSWRISPMPRVSSDSASACGCRR